MISCHPIADGKSGTLLDFIEDRQSGIRGNEEQQEAFRAEMHYIGIQLAYDESYSQAALNSFPMRKRTPSKLWMRQFWKWVHNLTPEEQVRFFSMGMHWL